VTSFCRRRPCSTPKRSPQRRGFNQSAHSVQAKPNKTKQESLDFLGFIRPNRDFSMGYDEKNNKKRLPSQVVFKTSQVHRIVPSPRALGHGGARARTLDGNIIALASDKHKQLFRGGSPA
jgi:hypothetical protein